MRRLRFVSFVPALFLLGCTHTPPSNASASAGGGAAASAAAGWQSEFTVDERDLRTTGRNAYFVLEPGYELVLEGREKKKLVTLQIRVLDETRRIGGIDTRVVEERESSGGELIEVSRNFFAISERTKDVYYFGEEVDVYHDGKLASHAGAWRHGEKGARFGLAMPGTPRVGQRYFQEHAPSVALDRGEVVSTTAVFSVPAGRFEDCLDVEETTPIEPDEHAHKLYAPGVGLLNDDELQLVRFGMVAAKPR
jgi:hypothetical protein